MQNNIKLHLLIKAILQSENNFTNSNNFFVNGRFKPYQIKFHLSKKYYTPKSIKIILSYKNYTNT